MKLEGRIVDRIDLALARMAERDMKVRCISLNAADMEELVKAATRAWRKATGSKARLHPLMFADHPIYQDHEVRMAKQSRVWSTHGVAVDVPKRLPAAQPKEEVNAEGTDTG